MLKTLFARFSRKRWWYEVELEYLAADGRVISTARTQVGLFSQEQILDGRALRKFLGGRFIAGIDKHLYCNGRLMLKIVCCLGRFKKEQPLPDGPVATTLSGLADKNLDWLALLFALYGQSAAVDFKKQRPANKSELSIRSEKHGNCQSL